MNTLKSALHFLGVIMIGLHASPSRASDIMAGVKCMNLGYTVVDPTYMGRTVSGFDQWACASRSGINIKGPPFPVVICNSVSQCGHVGWTY